MRTLAVLDHTALDKLRDLGHDLGFDLLSDIVQLYVDTSPRLLREVRTGFDQSDATAVEQAAHELKSSSAYLGVTCVSVLSARLEQLGQAGDLGTMGDLIPPLEQAYAAATHALNHALIAVDAKSGVTVQADAAAIFN